MEQNNENATTTAARKAVKGKGIDSEASRKSREDKGIQIRKDKRLDRANVERRKFKIDDEGGKSEQSSHTRLRNLEILPKKCELLLSDDTTKQLEAAVYFRRILAADKFPPLDLVIETKLIVPTLISYLKRFDVPTLQIEAAWSLTNIACGEAKHINCLVTHGAIPELIKVISITQNVTLRDQALWAICNISSDDFACQQLLYFPNILVPLVRQVGLSCPLYHQVPEGMDPSIVANRGVSCMTQFDMPDFPSLSTMRHIAFTLGNFARLRTTLSIQEYQFMVYAFADLIQSPDEDIISDICNSLIALSGEHPECVQLLVEQGLLSRAKECFELTVLSEITILVLCAVLRASCAGPTTSALIRLSALSHSSRNKSPLQFIIELLGKTDSNVSRKDVCSTLSLLLNVDPNKYAVQSVRFGAVSRLCAVVQQGCSFDVKLEAGQCLCKIVLNSLVVLDAPTANEASTLLFDLLGSTDFSLLSAAILAIHRLFATALTNRVLIANHGEVSDKLDLLTIHPYADIARIAQDFERLLERYQEAVSSETSMY